MLFKLAWRNLWRNKRRTLITLASVFFAVILSTLMMSFKEGVYVKMIDSMVGAFTGYAQIHNNGFWDDQILDNALVFSEDLQNNLNNVDELNGYTPRIESFALATSKELSKGSMVIGIDPIKEAEFSNLDERVSKGEYLVRDDNSALLGSGLAEYLELEVGDTIILLGQGYHGSSAAGKYAIKGLVKFGSPDLSKRLVFLPLEAAQWLYGTESMITSIVLHPQNQKSTDKLVKFLRNELDSTYEVMPWQELTPDLVNMIETDRMEGYVFMFILYMVISFGIFGTMLMMLAERKREFGVLIAIGMKRLRLAIIVFLELLIISILGAITGMIAAFPICAYFYRNPIQLGDELKKVTEEYGMEAVIQSSIEPAIFFQQASVVAFIAIVIAIYPFFKVRSLNVIKSMRS
jgi:ABC-type lipoprotein release transport system permease subunit